MTNFWSDLIDISGKTQQLTSISFRSPGLFVSYTVRCVFVESKILINSLLDFECLFATRIATYLEHVVLALLTGLLLIAEVCQMLREIEHGDGP